VVRVSSATKFGSDTNHRPRRVIGARSFEESEAHTKDPQALSRMKLNQMNCSTSGCHNIIHNVGQLKEATFWKEPAK
jgi:hypothetical protein